MSEPHKAGHGPGASPPCGFRSRQARGDAPRTASSCYLRRPRGTSGTAPSSGSRPASASPPGAPPPDNDLVIAHDGVSRRAGEITAHGAFRLLSNLSARHTYAVENPEGAGEHIKVAPGRLDAPGPFEFSRIVLPVAGDLLPIEVWAPRHDCLSGTGATDGEPTAPAFSVDRSERCFAVPAALRAAPRRPAPHPLGLPRRTTGPGAGCAATASPRRPTRCPRAGVRVNAASGSLRERAGGRGRQGRSPVSGRSGGSR